MSDEEDNNRKFKRCKIPETSNLEIWKFASENCQEIEIEDFSVDNNNNNLSLKESSQLAELFGIALGDGSIPESKYRLRITLNKSEEPQYTKYVNELMQRVFKKKVSVYEPKEADAIKLTINNKKLVENLVDKGLQPGDKKVNQVYVPQWVKDNKEYTKSCLRGLTDTDGSIHVHKANSSIRIGFKNASEPLMMDFKEMCEINDIKTGRIYPIKGENTYELHIESKIDVVKFIDKIRPRKWEYRAETIGLVLKGISENQKWISIENDLSKIYPDGRGHYNKEYKDILRQSCVNYGYDVSKQSIVNEIDKALTYSEKYTKLSKEIKMRYNEKARKIISKLEF